MINSVVEKKILNILIVDDDEDDFIILSEHIKSIRKSYEYNIVWCPSYKDALKETGKDNYEIYFIDFLLNPVFKEVYAASAHVLSLTRAYTRLF